MKVLFVAHNASIEGAGIAFANICHCLSKSGIEIIAVIPGKRGVAELVKDIPNVNVRIIREIKNEVYPSTETIRDKIMYFPRLIRLICFRPIFKRKLKKIIRSEKPDLIHSNTGTLRIPSLLAERYRIPHVWHIRECQSIGYNFKPFGGENQVKQLFSKKCNNCIFITKSVADYYGFNDDKDSIIYDGVFTNEIIESKQNINPKKKNIILFVGLISEIKGVPMLLDAFEKVSPEIPEYELWLAGKDRINIQDRINQLTCKNKIKYLGFRKDVYDLMAQSQILVVPSKYEGFGFITAEAMLNHTLVIGRDIAGTKEQMDNAAQMKGREVALRFNTAEELAEALNTASKINDSEYKAITEDAFDVVCKLYTTERNAENILEFYKHVISKRNQEK